MPHNSKTLGAYFTPEAVAAALVQWAVRDPADLLLDPSSGDGRFVAPHGNSVGFERDPVSVADAACRAPHAAIVEADFFTWASDDRRRFDCAAGNPPFIRYQRFTGATRRAALSKPPIRCKPQSACVFPPRHRTPLSLSRPRDRAVGLNLAAPLHSSAP